MLTEGAGGWFTPLSATLTFADWVQTEQLPVILVVGVKLGCINHAMLTALAVEQAGLPLVGWIANDVQPPGARHGEYLATLRRVIPAPLLGKSRGWAFLHRRRRQDSIWTLAPGTRLTAPKNRLLAGSDDPAVLSPDPPDVAMLKMCKM